MKNSTIVAAVLAVLGVVAIVSEAWAACPQGTRYSCYQGYNGKVVCSCT